MLHLVGDVNLTEGAFDVGIGVGSKIMNGLDPFGVIDRSLEDKWIGNFEGVASDTSVNKDMAARIFRIEPEFLKNIQHCDYYGVANNHVMQHGGDAYQQTLDSIKSFGSDYFGTVKKKSLIFAHQDKMVSLTGFSLRPDNFSEKPLYWSLPENCDLAEELRALKQEGANYHIAFVHGGVEFINYPYNDEKTFYRAIIDMGYDMVVGMHPHVLQGYELWHGKYIFYSIGNFEFNMAWEKTHYGAIVNIDLNGNDPRVTTDYVYIDGGFQPHIVEESEVPEECRFSHLNSLISIHEENERYFGRVRSAMSLYRKANHKWFLKNLAKMPKGFVYELVKAFATGKTRS